MMEEIKKGLKLIRYGYGLKLNLIGGFVFWLLGMLLFFLPIEGMLYAGVLYIMLGPLMLAQIGYTLLYANVVASSPRRRLMEITIPDFVTLVSGGISYIIVVVDTAMKVKSMPEQANDNCEMLLFVGLSIALIMIYYGAAYKYYWLSSAVFFLFLLVIFTGGIICVKLFDLKLNIVSASLICLVIVALGALLAGLIRRGLYKKTLSPMACGATLRKALQ